MDSFRFAGGAERGVHPDEKAVAEMELGKIGKDSDQQGRHPESQGQESIPAADQSKKPFRLSEVNPARGEEGQDL
jgi:hypothetical protein